MGILLAFAVGYVVGARGGERGYQDVVAALRELRDSEEFSNLVDALRSHVGGTLEEVAGWLTDRDEPVTVESVLDRARRLVAGEDRPGPTTSAS
jgi:hypothetical protein